MYKFFIFLFLSVAPLFSTTPKFEGILGEPVFPIKEFQTESLVRAFIPYNPKVVCIGGFDGKSIFPLVNDFPHGKFYVFEPNPRAFNLLQSAAENINKSLGSKVISTYKQAVNNKNGITHLYICQGPYGNDPELDKWSSILPPKNPVFLGPVLDVPCVKLDDWCDKQAVDKIDFLFLDIEGAEMLVLESSPRSIQKSFVIALKTYQKPFRVGTVCFERIKSFLYSKGFVLLAHWYLENKIGEAIFIRQEVYNSMFQ